MRQRNMALDRMQRDIFFNDIGSGDIVTKEHMIMLLPDYVALLLCLTYDYVIHSLFFCYYVF